MKEKQYAERDAYELDVAGNYYCRHVSAMTSEGLHSKGDIAAELGHRDMVIDGLIDAVKSILTLQTRGYITLGIEHTKSLRAAISKALGEE